MHKLFENDTDLVELVVDPTEHNSTDEVSFAVYKRQSLKLADGTTRMVRNCCIKNTPRFGNATRVDPATMRILGDEEPGGVGMYDFVRRATPNSLGLEGMDSVIHDSMAGKVEATMLVNGLVTEEELAQ